MKFCYDRFMATRVEKSVAGDFNTLPPEGPELDTLIKAMVAEADADPRPPVPLKEAFERIRANIARNG
jgi:antitoxin ParD1/3/4